LKKNTSLSKQFQTSNVKVNKIKYLRKNNPIKKEKEKKE
jgi:hypothetical protein